MRRCRGRDAMRCFAVRVSLAAAGGGVPIFTHAARPLVPLLISFSLHCLTSSPRCLPDTTRIKREGAMRERRWLAYVYLGIYKYGERDHLARWGDVRVFET